LWLILKKYLIHKVDQRTIPIVQSYEESCGFIGKGKIDNNFIDDNLVEFNNSVISTFSISQSRGLLTTNQYKVLTVCHYNQSCVEWLPQWIDNNPYGYFLQLFADINNDTKVSLNEVFEYIEFLVSLLEMADLWDNKQDVQVCPSDSNFTILEYYRLVNLCSF